MEENNGRETTSLKINPKVWKEAKLYCVEHEISMSDFIECLIKEKLKLKN